MVGHLGCGDAALGMAEHTERVPLAIRAAVRIPSGVVATLPSRAALGLLRLLVTLAAPRPYEGGAAGLEAGAKRHP